jgi:hypothetical protein
MRRGLWILAAIGVAGIVILVILTHTTLSGVSGIEEAVALQETLRSSYDHLVEPTPPLMVYRVPGSPEWPGFRWKIEATLRSNWRPGSPEVNSATARMVARAVGTQVQGKGPAGVMVLLHAPGRPDLTALFDREGLPFDPAAKKPEAAKGAPR